jgi:hypothetical protein
MKKLLVTLTLVFAIAASSFAQKTPAMDAVVKAICEIGDRKDFDKKGQNEIEMEFGVAIMPHLEAVGKELGYKKKLDDETVHSISQAIGIKAASVCPKLFLKLAQMEDEAAASDSVAVAVAAVSNLTTTACKIDNVSLTASTFITLTVVNEVDEKSTFIWTNPSSDDLAILKGNLKNKKAIIKSSVFEYYDTTKGKTVKARDIQSIELK